jgi:hypothetical protein
MSAKLFEFSLVIQSRMNFLGKKNLLETMNVAVDVLFEIRHAPAPVDQEQSCREKSADCHAMMQSCCLEALSSQIGEDISM